MIRSQFIDTPWGLFAAVAGDRGLLATFLPGSTPVQLEAMIADRWPEARRLKDAVPGLRRAVTDYFAGRPTPCEFDLDLSGFTPFRQQVLRACERIPRGETAAYADLARAVGRPNAMRAVGSTMANNPLPLLIPCHRVVRSDGGLGGFSGPHGLNLKRRMLEHERVMTTGERRRVG